MKPPVSALAVALVFTLLAGCWDNSELDEYGYVQAVAIDRRTDGLIQVTTHFYNPANKNNQVGGNTEPVQKGINIATSGETIMEAIRDIPTALGRKAKWDHMRVILLGEELARTENVREVLDFFSRDHEPRGTVLPLIAEQAAGPFLDVRPFVEQTIGQQYKKMENNGARYSADSSDIPLYDFAIKLKGPSKTAELPYLHRGVAPQEATVSGVAIIRNGKLADILDESDTEAFLMLTGRYTSGVIEFPCLENGKEHTNAKESFEVVTLNGSTVPTVAGDKISVRVKIRIEGTVGELRCSHLKTKDDVARFERMIDDTVERQLRQTIERFKRNELDAIGIASRIYRMHPKLWKRLEPEWKQRFAQIDFQVGVTTRVLSTSMNVGTPFGTKEK
ncbi:Ger(x)C family spore germination protein [Paenibacillus cymbidii]|uniref:Ger(x)C family spore germination protein n=1 Tax=Paenibacillus cymbidii TaxID=1639034 RepID=UPI0010811EFD|nr:Ger(x)C family spore germination protein [Paenibacillus cymbidii]